MVVLLVALALSALTACGRRASEEPAPDPAGGGAASGAGAASDLPLPDRIDAALARSGDFLIGKQGADGAIRSGTYAYFKDGYSLTPLALAALFGVPDDPRVARAYQRAVDFTTTMVTRDGVLRQDRDAPRYPLYSIALGAIVLNVPRNDRHRAVRDALVAALRERQLVEKSGWARTDPAYGSWSYFDGIPRRPPGPRLDEELASTLPGNLSSTLFAAGALFLAGVAPTDPSLVAARVFVERCQNYADPPGPADDGGFFFSTSVPDSNKAGPAAGAPGRYRSYGSATADGVRALLRLGLPPDHPRVVAAAAWLERRFDPERNPGDFVPVGEIRRASSYYYWTWSAAHALRDLGKTTLRTRAGEVRWAEALATSLLARQRRDGSWSNPSAEMREDDPVVATSFATAALAICRHVLGGPFRSHAAQR